MPKAWGSQRIKRSVNFNTTNKIPDYDSSFDYFCDRIIWKKGSIISPDCIFEDIYFYCQATTKGWYHKVSIEKIKITLEQKVPKVNFLSVDQTHSELVFDGNNPTGIIADRETCWWILWFANIAVLTRWIRAKWFWQRFYSLMVMLILSQKQI